MKNKCAQNKFFSFLKKIVVFFIAFFVFDCKQIIIQKTVQEEYLEAFNLYKKKKYEQACNLFKRLCYRVIGKNEEINTRYFLAKALYKLKSYELASKEFGDLISLVGFFHKKSEKIIYTKVFCLYKIVKSSKLDQQISYKLLDNVNMYFSAFSEGKHAVEIKTILAKIKKKLIKKSVAQIEVFFNQKKYKAVVVSCNNFLEENELNYATEKVWLLKMKSLDQLIQSIKKTESVKNVVYEIEDNVIDFDWVAELFKSIASFMNLFLESKHRAEVENLFRKHYK